MNKSKGKVRRRIWRKRLHKVWKQNPRRWRRTPPLIFKMPTPEDVEAFRSIVVRPFPILENKPIMEVMNDAGDEFSPPEQRDGDPIAMQCREHGTWYIDPLEILEPHRCPQCEVQDHAPKDAK